MIKVNVHLDKNSFPELVRRVALKGERVVIEQEGKVTAAIINYADFKLFEALEARLKAEQEEYEWLKAAIRNPAFDSLKKPVEDIYTLAYGKPYHDPEWIKTIVSEPSFGSITDPEEDIYTFNDGKPYYDKG